MDCDLFCYFIMTYFYLHDFHWSSWCLCIIIDLQWFAMIVIDFHWFSNVSFEFCTKFSKMFMDLMIVIHFHTFALLFIMLMDSYRIVKILLSIKKNAYILLIFKDLIDFNEFHGFLMIIIDLHWLLWIFIDVNDFHRS